MLAHSCPGAWQEDVDGVSRCHISAGVYLTWFTYISYAGSSARSKSPNAVQEVKEQMLGSVESREANAAAQIVSEANFQLLQRKARQEAENQVLLC